MHMLYTAHVTASISGYHRKHASAVTIVCISALHNIEGDDCEQQQTAKIILHHMGPRQPTAVKKLKIRPQ